MQALASKFTCTIDHDYLKVIVVGGGHLDCGLYTRDVVCWASEQMKHPAAPYGGIDWHVALSKADFGLCWQPKDVSLALDDHAGITCCVDFGESGTSLMDPELLRGFTYVIIAAMKWAREQAPERIALYSSLPEPRVTTDMSVLPADPEAGRNYTEISFDVPIEYFEPYTSVFACEELPSARVPPVDARGLTLRVIIRGRQICREWLAKNPVTYDASWPIAARVVKEQYSLICHDGSLIPSARLRMHKDRVYVRQPINLNYWWHESCSLPGNWSLLQGQPYLRCTLRLRQAYHDSDTNAIPTIVRTTDWRRALNAHFKNVYRWKMVTSGHYGSLHDPD